MIQNFVDFSGVRVCKYEVTSAKSSKWCHQK